MKKLLAVLLTMAMLVTMLAFGASAEKEVGGDNGVESFDPTTSDGQDLNVKVTEVTHKYAVDVTFGITDLTINGFTWNVNTMRYDVDSDQLKDTTQTISVSNRSDRPVYAYASVAMVDNQCGISISADKDNSPEKGKLTIEAANAGTSGKNGTAKDANIEIAIAATDWTLVGEYYAAQKLKDETQVIFKIATITVTITKDN